MRLLQEKPWLSGKSTPPLKESDREEAKIIRKPMPIRLPEILVLERKSKRNDEPIDHAFHLHPKHSFAKALSCHFYSIIIDKI